MALKLEIIYRTPIAFLYQEFYLRLREVIRAKEEKCTARKCRKSTDV
jgi:hypothetical protein